MRTAASAQLADIQKRMATLPGELDALRTQGAADVKSEQARIAEAATHERERLLTQTRREIDTRLRIAKRELTEHAAMLAVQVAEQRIKREITPDDQVRLIDRYSSQLREAR
jgi:F-type H+-transporting ATPase subunit b